MDHRKQVIWIPGNVPSSKNSRTFNMRMKRSFASKTVQRYIRSTKSFYEENKKLFLSWCDQTSPPHIIEFTFVRGTKHKFDYINPAQTVQDLMVKYGWIEDDNCTIMKPQFGDYSYDKDNPGVYIRLVNGKRD